MSSPLEKQSPDSFKTMINLTWKTVVILVILNMAFAAVNPIPVLSRLSLYNIIFPGRVRLPFGENPEKAYNFSLYQVPAMFAAHEAAQPKPENEIRIFLIGDSSTWGYLLEPQETLAAQLNRRFAQDGRYKSVRVYNFGYPTITLTKDLMILEQALLFKPDLIIWLTTLEAFPISKQLDSPILQNNADLTRILIAKHELNLDPQDPRLMDKNTWDKTIFGSRRALADLLRLQVYGILWSATGIDQFIPEKYDRPQSDLANDESFQGIAPPRIKAQDLSWDVLAAGIQLAATSDTGKAPPGILLVNEPIYISQGQNSTIRYNFFYPRWAYDQYRTQLNDFAELHEIPYLDAWNLVPAENFTNSAIHIDAKGEQILAEAIFNKIASLLKTP